MLKGGRGWKLPIIVFKIRKKHEQSINLIKITFLITNSEHSLEHIERVFYFSWVKNQSWDLLHIFPLLDKQIKFWKGF